MSRVLEFADEVAGLTPGLDQAQIITNDFTTTANKNSVFFGSITFNATNPVTVVANSELIFHDADVDFKQGFNIQGTLNWITGGGTTDKDVSGLQINGTTVIDSNRNIINVPLIQAIGVAGVSIASAVYTADNRTGTSGALTVKSPSSDVSAAAASREPVATFTGGSTDTKKLDFYIDTSAATTKTGIAAYDSSGGATELGFYTGTSATERVTIDSNGNVGIGVTAPDVPLQVKGVIETQATNSTNGWLIYTHTDNTFRLNYNGAGNDEVVITDNGYVGIGTAAPTSKLYVVDGGGIFDVQDSTGHARFTQASGSAQIGLFRSGNSVGGGYIGGDGSYLLNVFNTSFSKKASIDPNGNMNISGSLTQNSDIRLKENITDYTKGTTELMQIQVRQWQYNGKGETNLGQNGLGVIADEIENVLPNTVDTYPAKLNADDEIETDIKRFAASEITWLLVNTCKEQQTIIESQQAQIDALTARITALENQ